MKRIDLYRRITVFLVNRNGKIRHRRSVPHRLLRFRHKAIRRARGSGKTNHAYQLAEDLMQAGAIVYVFDPSQAWMKKSSIPEYQRITLPFGITTLYRDPEIPDDSTVFDISMLYVPQQQEFVEKFCRKLFTERTKSRERPQTFLIFEEAQLYLPEGRMRSKAAQELMRIITVGRNFNIRYGLITQFASTVDKLAVKMTKQRYFGFSDELNDVKYLTNFIGKKWASDLGSLKIGEFIYDYGTRTQRIQTPLFETETPPSPVLPKIPEPTRIKPLQIFTEAEVNPAAFWKFIAFVLFVLLILSFVWRR